MPAFSHNRATVRSTNRLCGKLAIGLWLRVAEDKGFFWSVKAIVQLEEVNNLKWIKSELPMFIPTPESKIETVHVQHGIY